MTTDLSQGEFNIDRMCWLAGVTRASYYRHWLESAPRRAETGLRDLIQKLALDNAHYGYVGSQPCRGGRGGKSITHLKASLAIEALEMAISDREPVPGSLIHHSDRGVQGGFKRSSQH
ncbi:hypothetical protein [Mesorhizobium sp. M0159]|uniref:hypothetical protein n=1 Tax=Mesorhizobium sp. M0159 TaxID=2956900 RepID=UPI003334E245